MKFFFSAFFSCLQKPTGKVIVVSAAVFIVSFRIVLGQSTAQDFPTPVSSNEISAKISARDIGDPRITTHFYIFEGDQGDIFINVVAENFNGDIDVFQAGSMKPLAKLKIFAESTEFESGRVIYLQKRDRLILRIAGKSPNDDPSTYRLKFAGSFLALAPENVEVKSEVSVNEVSRDSKVRVNSVGTIISRPSVPPPKTNQTVSSDAMISKPVMPADETSAKTASEKESTAMKEEEPNKEKKESKAVESGSSMPPKKQKEMKKTQSDDVPIVRFRRRRNSNENETKAPDETKSGGAVQNPKSDSSADVSAQPSRTENNDAKRTPDSKESAASENPSTEKEKTTANVGDPLARVNLVVVLKDGRKLEYSLADVLRFHVDGGILTITGKDGKVESYSMSQVQRVTIE